jgi:type IV pilus assembly protein PilY1
VRQAISKIAVVTIIVCLLVLGLLRADETEIHGTITINVQPNVLIIFDTSGSMGTADVPGEYYNPATTYDGSYITNAVYREMWSWFWKWYELFADDVNDLQCDCAKNNLLTKGYVTGFIRDTSGSYQCGGSEKKLLIGNYLNYHESGVATKTRIQAAREVITDLINDTDTVRFGLMRFNNDQGGRIVAECGTDKTTLINTINGLTADGWTPIGETLAEAGLYFAGMGSWYNSGVTYTSPMQEPCQKNYIILMTDGEPTQDRDWRLASGTYINGDTIGDYDGDGNDPGSSAADGSDYLDDVANYLYENDCNPTLGTGTSCEKQNIITYTMGFRTEQQLLQDTATNGGGRYYTAQDISEVSEAFEEIMASITVNNFQAFRPALYLPEDNATVASLTPKLQTEAFPNPCGADPLHAQTEWQISAEIDFSSLLLDVTSADDLISIEVPQSLLGGETTYYWRARFYDTNAVSSDWSETYSFTTPKPVPTGGGDTCFISVVNVGQE